MSTMVINCPIEVVKTVLQSKTMGDKTTWRKHYVAPYEGMWGCIQGIYKERGIIGFYKGGLPLMCRYEEFYHSNVFVVKLKKKKQLNIT